MALHTHGNVKSSKAREILRDGSVRGHPLTSKQRGFFGARAGGQSVKPTRREAFQRLRKRV